MDNFLLNAEQVDLTGQDIINITNNDVSIMEYSQLQMINDINDLFINVNCVALLYETKKDYGHWTAIIKHNENTIEFFDPYGLSPDEELKYASYHVRTNEDGLLVPHLSYLFKISGFNIIHNKVRVQKFLPDVNTCGRHIALRIKFKKTALNRYLSLLMHNRFYDPDLWVTALTIAYSI